MPCAGGTPPCTARCGHMPRDSARKLRHHTVMTNRLALWIGAALLAAIMADILLYDAEHLLFLGRRFFVLLDWIAFWR
ncbi:hypothetical protein SAMN04487993_102817 [Salipiger marinus]|uniref:Glyceraldehyde-3-phosphate dehydrogenase n=1 Tax=Salipiger marinus TaxID=555512 RepID=A0A1G8T6J1_9RHOB|nr:hypothetical protein SAMN04487993_102817 [Salipiger marinus]